MTADRLRRLYPRAWRERYGEEFLATIGDGALRLQQIVDIVAGAIDAWVARDVRRQPPDERHWHSARPARLLRRG